MFDIKLLGPGQVYYNGKAITGFPGQQHCLLFYYLLLNRQTPHTREQVATVFWGDSPASLARKNLRNILWRLSQAFQSAGASLDDLIISQEDCIAFTDTNSYRLDIDMFEVAARRSSDHTNDELDYEQVSLLESAAELYKSDLLEGVYEDWCLYERERLRLAFLNILIRLMSHHGRIGNYERSLEYGRRILLHEPTREKVHRQMMMLHWLAGDREAALSQYRSCCQTLQTELSLKPMQETQQLRETILRSSTIPDRQILNDSESLPGSLTTRQGQGGVTEVLQKLYFLETIVEQASTELRLLQQMIHKGLTIK